MTFRFQDGRSSPVAEVTGHTVPRHSHYNGNTNPTSVAKASGEKRQGRSEDQDPRKSPQQNQGTALRHRTPSAHNRSPERYSRRPDRDSHAGPTA